jgi:hypothetical protein
VAENVFDLFMAQHPPLLDACPVAPIRELVEQGAAA